MRADVQGIEQSPQQLRGDDFGQAKLILVLSTIPFHPQILPIRVVLLDQIELPFASSFLDQLFTRDGIGDILVPLGIDQHCLAGFLHMLRSGT